MSPALTSYPSFALLPFPPNRSHSYHPYSPLSSLSKLTLNPISSGLPNWSGPLRDGLPTPPADMNGVAYNAHPSYAPKQYSSHQYAAKTSSNRVPLANTVSNAAANYLPPLNKQAEESADTKSQKRSEKESLPSYSQIPSSIRKTGGNLAEFAAQIACLFWFEKTSKLKSIEDGTPQKYALVPEAFPTVGFQKWVSSVLSTTQVSQNVILLALLFIYRLKNFNPGVRGKKGSEFRLMTIALMMGNKFLDDNTYTNKTWAEVSGITVQEIHIMEVEFLSNVRYNLFVSKEEWTQWHSRLGRFADFFERASCMPPENEFAPTTPVQISPTADARRYNLPVSPASKLPSPPSTTNPLQPQTQLQSMPRWNPASAPAASAPYRLNSSPHAIPNFEFPPYSRKRSWEDDVEENPSKRMAVSNYSAPMPMPVSTATTVPSVPVLPPVLNSMPMSVPSLAMPVPRLSQPTTYQPVSNGLVPPTLPASTLPQQLPLPHVRAMTTVYPPSSWSQPIPSTVTPVPAVQNQNPMALYNPSTVSLPDPSRRQSPYSATVSSDAVSPSSAFHVHTPQTHLSPSFFLVNRNSPYRPVRAVNTLLIPPPSASLHQPRHLSMDQMHYQPLGKSFTERRTGVLPYLHPDGLPQGVIPQQPNFLPGQY
ncbi:mucin, putative [Talaromyces stipitatus ATCC 10500]|uniref:Mucin, putative n=1 Tax=Talaromyces stipitatus (strain ATCC 10500 / CBS 375.48 / QM 6759 / NRRL 1006) TaxID=441959 RepID=B8MK53_TALSN|nr:mucin, putative [Talaromyces stipitatus ATCC 10500]EED14870.1 mucin, putative [Talaromyces stipitatus ATCC 10500]